MTDRVYVATDRGLWRPEGHGYCATFAEAGLFDRADAERWAREMPDKGLRITTLAGARVRLVREVEAARAALERAEAALRFVQGETTPTPASPP